MDYLPWESREGKMQKNKLSWGGSALSAGKFFFRVQASQVGSRAGEKPPSKSP